MKGLSDDDNDFMKICSSDLDTDQSWNLSSSQINVFTVSLKQNKKKKKKKRKGKNNNNNNAFSYLQNISNC